MAHITYHVIEHDGGWCYRALGVYSETYRSRDAALKAATQAAAEQRTGGETAEIQYQDSSGAWHTEHADGGDRPDTDVEIDD